MDSVDVNGNGDEICIGTGAQSAGKPLFSFHDKTAGEPVKRTRMSEGATANAAGRRLWNFRQTLSARSQTGSREAVYERRRHHLNVERREASCAEPTADGGRTRSGQD